jgi:hypothetical protein
VVDALRLMQGISERGGGEPGPSALAPRRPDRREEGVDRRDDRIDRRDRRCIVVGISAQFDLALDEVATTLVQRPTSLKKASPLTVRRSASMTSILAFDQLAHDARARGQVVDLERARRDAPPWQEERDRLRQNAGRDGCAVTTPAMPCFSSVASRTPLTAALRLVTPLRTSR